MKDPTETSSIRQAWVRQFNIRFRKLRGQVNTLFTQGKIPFDAAFVAFFSAWFERAARSLLGGRWTRKYIEDAYVKGLITSGMVTPESAMAVAASGEHLKTIDSLHKAIEAEVDAVITAMKSQSVEMVQRGIEQGISKKAMAEQIKDRINKVGNTRSVFIANTKTPYAANLAKVKTAIMFDNDEIQFLWITRQDERVRTTHALRNRKVYSQKAALNLIGEPNCRCSITPILKDEKVPKGYKDIRRQGLAISEQAQKERKFWATLRKGERAEGLNHLL